MSSEIYRYLNFNEIESYQNSANEGKRIAAVEIQTVAV
jgi:aconitate hydratase 2/2-methylisocitrate dehydratase